MSQAGGSEERWGTRGGVGGGRGWWGARVEAQVPGQPGWLNQARLQAGRQAGRPVGEGPTRMRTGTVQGSLSIGFGQFKLELD